MNEEPEFYGPWRIARRIKSSPVAGIEFMIRDDNGNTMAYAEDDYFLTEAIRRINAYETMLELVQEVAKDYPDAADWKDARSRLCTMARGIMLKVRG